MSFQLVPKSVTLNDLEWAVAVIFVISVKSVAFGAHCVKVVGYSQTFCDENVVQSF